MDPIPEGGKPRETASLHSPRTPAGRQDQPRTPEKDDPPHDFGDYRFIELLGRGAFGRVYRVWSESKQRYEAMKILHRESAFDKEHLEAFQHEVQRIANVRNPYVVQVFHVDVLPDGRPFFTMEYVSGGRLDHCCDRTRRSLEERIRAVADVCDAVHKLHELNVVHCDIKPANIVVDEDDGVMVPKLVDFGLASQRAFKLSPSSVPRGTLPYMAPEQLESRGGDPERQWDVYALGVTLYQLVVGECPIQHFPDLALPPEALAEHIRRTPVPPLWDRPTLIGSPQTGDLAAARKLSVERFRRRLHDPWLDGIVRKALAKDRRERYATAGEMAENLREYLRGARPPVIPPTLRDRVREMIRSHRKAIAAAVLILALSVAVVSLRARHLAARDETVLRLFHEASSTVDPLLAIDRYHQAIAVDPSRSDIRLHLAGAWAAHGDLEKALETARAIPKDDRYFPEAQAFVRGLSQFRSGASQTGAGDVSTPDVSPSDAYYYALSLPRSKAAKAVSLLTMALDRRGLTYREQFLIRLHRAMRYFQLCDYEALDAEAQWLVDTMPDSAVAWNLRGVAHRYMERPTVAIRAYHEALRLNPTYISALLNRAHSYNRLGQYDLALSDCDRIEALAPTHQGRVMSERLHAWTGKGEAPLARRACEVMLNESQADPYARLECTQLWYSLWQWDSMWTEADRTVNSGLELAPSCDQLLLPNALYSRGIAATYLGRYADAIADFDRAEALDPDRWRSDRTRLLLHAKVLLLHGEWERAVSCLRRIIENSPDDPDGAMFYLWMWDAQRQIGDTAGASVSLESARKSAGIDRRLLNLVGHCAGTVSEKSVLEDAGSNVLFQTEARYYLGLAAKARGDLGQAALHFRTCRELNQQSKIENQLAVMQLAQLTENP